MKNTMREHSLQKEPGQEIRERALLVQLELDTLFPHPPIPLDHDGPFTLLVAVVLSAQCTDVRVNQITPILFERIGRTPADFAASTPEEIREIIRPCGLSPAKSKALHGIGVLLQRQGGTVPRTLEELEKLPGVGHKTASVVASHAFGVPAFPVDTHIHRCAARWGLSDGHSVERTEADLKALFSPSSWEKLHLQIIHFARRYCPARGHRIEECPICRLLFPG